MSIEAEQAVLASCINSAEGYDAVSEHLKADDFTDDRMRLLFELVSKMREAGRTPDTVTITAVLGKSERWARTGLDDPLEYVNAIESLSYSFIAVSEYIEIIKSASIARRMLQYCSELAEVAYDGNLNADEKLAEMQSRLPSFESGGQAFLQYGDAAKLAAKQIIARAQGEISGISSGMESIDKMTGGFEPGTLVILAGRPSHGKSVWGMQFAHAAAKAGAVFVFSLEMTSANVAMRGLASIGKVDFGFMRQGKIDDHMSASIQQAKNQMAEMPLYIDDRGGISVDQLRTRARVMARKEKPAMIVTDYLTLLSGVGENRTQQVGYVSRSLKSMAKELDCPVVCLAQLNRGVDNRADRRPTLSDLRDSGEIEQDSDIVMFTYLHEKYEQETQRKGIGELIFAKQRNGETGNVFAEWQGKYQRFVEFKGVVPPEAPFKEDGDKVDASAYASSKGVY